MNETGVSDTGVGIVEYRGESFDLATLRDRARYARLRAGLGITEAAERAGVSDNAIYLIERGVTQSIKRRNLAAFATAYGVSDVWLRSGVGAPVDDQMEDDMYLRHKGITSEDGRRQFFDFIEYLRAREDERGQ